MPLSNQVRPLEDYKVCLLYTSSTAARLKLKGIDGGPHKQWSMWFNSKQREEPYQVLTSDAVSYTHLDVYKRQVHILWKGRNTALTAYAAVRP